VTGASPSKTGAHRAMSVILVTRSATTMTVSRTGTAGRTSTACGVSVRRGRAHSGRPAALLKIAMETSSVPTTCAPTTVAPMMPPAEETLSQPANSVSA